MYDCLGLDCSYRHGKFINVGRGPLKRIVLGAAIGAEIIALAGFTGLGWTLGSTAQEMAKKNSEAAVVGALAPICAGKLQYAADAMKNQIELMRFNSNDQAAFINQGGLALFPGSISSNNSAVAGACVKLLSEIE